MCALMRLIPLWEAPRPGGSVAGPVRATLDVTREHSHEVRQCSRDLRSA